MLLPQIGDQAVALPQLVPEPVEILALVVVVGLGHGGKPPFKVETDMVTVGPG